MSSGAGAKKINRGRGRAGGGQVRWFEQEQAPLRRARRVDVARSGRPSSEVAMRLLIMTAVLLFGFSSVSAAETVTYVLETPGVV